MQSKVKIQYESRMLCGRLIDSFKYFEHPTNFVINEIQLKGVQIALMSMKIGEEAYIMVQPDYHYGKTYKMTLSD
jgi:FKBP-type peptidyl-prolyl cis-trans isomerase